jgi:hypothetical protein
MEPDQKGISRLAVIPVRGSASDKSEQVTQLLFGDHFTVKEVDGNWLKIEVYDDQYTGWIDYKQFHAISDAYFEQINLSNYKVCTDLVASILYHKNLVPVTIGSIIPISTNELFKIEEHLGFNGDAKSLSERRDFEYCKFIAMKYLNAPYQWGGKSPFGIDCSGFTQIVFKICGYRLLRDASQQVKQGREVVHFADADLGDLLFFSDEQNNVVHVGILFENQTIMHGSGKVRIDLIDENGIFNVELNRYTHKLSHIRSVMSN